MVITPWFAALLHRRLDMLLRQSWNLLEDSAFTYTGPDWILALLNSANKDIRVKLMLLFWRIWHHRHDNVFGTGECLISVSVFFLENYLHSLKLGGDTTHPVNAKGKDLYTSNLDFLKQNDQTTIHTVNSQSTRQVHAQRTDERVMIIHSNSNTITYSPWNTS